MKYYIPAIICGISIFWLSVTSGANLPETFADLLSFDKVAHGVAYGTQTALLLFGAYKSRSNLLIINIVLIGFGVAFYGFLMEIIQYYFFPGRHFEVLDILANIMGIVITLLIFNFFLNKTTAA